MDVQLCVNILILLVYHVMCVNGQFLVSSGFDPCPRGYQRYGTSCYRYMHLTVSWMEASKVCETMSAHIVSIDNQVENRFLTDLVRNETRNNSTSKIDTLAERIWTSATNFYGELLWMDDNSQVTYTSWAHGEPYVTSSKDVYCVMKMADDWYSDVCTHVRNFVCEKELDGLVIPDRTTSEPKMDQTTASYTNFPLFMKPSPGDLFG